ncbi:hypothetical protein [Sporosarcina sp. FSL K6-3457]|uniref:hypothetical protein n=1 Tax=Sporosarcina sp. FSL K6-3457 TaxID=2978204 RepID=UPI0030FBF9C3
MAKKKDSTPRRKKYNKAQRLRDAKAKWLPTVTAKNIVRSYSKWYGVDLLCAINELEILGYKSSDNYKKQVELSIASKADAKRRRKEAKEEQDGALYGSDDTFSFIAGYTEGGAPFGTTWEEE